LSKIVEIKLDNAAYGGESIGRLPDGRAVFVPFGIPGETVRIKIVVDKKKFARGELLEVLESSPSRVSARCPHYLECGGCHYQHIAYEQQLLIKQKVLRDQLERIGRLAQPPIESVVPSPNHFNYRNQVKFQINRSGKLGFVRANKQGVLEITECHLPELALTSIFHLLEIDPDSRLSGLGLRLGIEDDVLVTLESKYRFDAEFDIQTLPVSVVHISPELTEVLAGSEYTVVQVKDRQFRVSAGSFFQVNSALAEQMLDRIESALPAEPGLVLELYSGVGLFSAFIASRTGKLVSIEASESAADDFEYNLDEFNNVDLYLGPVEDILPDLYLKPDVVLADPPRTGLHKRAVEYLISVKPKSLIYISCDPSTLARDSKLLTEAGYNAQEFIPFDFFPQTYHIETLSIWKT
jgi:23S rRNA (uracil1939-C5)-methyltransferase